MQEVDYENILPTRQAHGEESGSILQPPTLRHLHETAFFWQIFVMAITIRHLHHPWHRSLCAHPNSSSDPSRSTTSSRKAVDRRLPSRITDRAACENPSSHILLSSFIRFVPHGFSCVSSTTLSCLVWGFLYPLLSTVLPLCVLPLSSITLLLSNCINDIIVVHAWLHLDQSPLLFPFTHVT